MKGIATIITLPAWILGIIIAKGFWSTFFAVIIPLWSWYLSFDYLFHKYGVL